MRPGALRFEIDKMSIVLWQYRVAFGEQGRPVPGYRPAGIEPPAASLPVNKWIVGETVKTVQALDIAIAELRFDFAEGETVRLTFPRGALHMLGDGP